MTREEAIYELERMKTWSKELSDEEIEAIVIALKALSRSEISTPCEDAVSRQAVLEGLASIAKAKAKSDAQKSLMGRVMFFTERLPSVTPQPKMGHWEWVRYDGIMGNWHCSECRTIIPHMPEETDNTPIYKWCPMCGIRMVQEAEE